MANAFDGIQEKLKRANENIRNLDSEISRFFQECKYPVLPDPKDKLFLEAIKYHGQLTIPLRFSVLAGEIVHHLRSCLDHLVWQFSASEARKSTAIEFPIFDHEPINEKQIARYEGKIKGITNPAVRDLITRLQPYNSPDYIDSPLSIIHHMDIFYKHRELVLHYTTGSLLMPASMRPIVESYKREHPDVSSAELTSKFKSYGTLVPQIAFKNFGRRDIEPVSQALLDLYNSTVVVVAYFESLHVA
jgi:hypothetical protein